MQFSHSGRSGFRLSAVLQLREGERDKMAHALAKIEDSLLSIDRRLRSIADERSDSQKVIRHHRIGRIPIERLLDHHRYEMQLDESEDLLKRERLTLLEQSRAKRERLVEANLELKKIEQLAERERKNQERKDRLDQQKVIDDFAIAAFWRKTSSSFTADD